jgi:hypothetical protein
LSYFLLYTNSTIFIQGSIPNYYVFLGAYGGQNAKLFMLLNNLAYISIEQLAYLFISFIILGVLFSFAVIQQRKLKKNKSDRKQCLAF